MHALQQYIADVPDFPKPGITFRDISPLLRYQLSATIDALDALLTPQEWDNIEALAGIESRGFVLAAALAVRRGKGLVMARKQGKLPPPAVRETYTLEYGADALEMKPGQGRLALVDDVLATGGTMRAAANLCVAAGYEPIALLALLDLNLVKSFEWRSLRVRSVVRYA